MDTEQVNQLAKALLLNTDFPTMEDVQSVAKRIKTFLNLEESVTDIFNVITADRNIYQPPSSAIVEDEEGANWLVEFRAEGKSDWRFWVDYKKHLTLPSAAINEIDRTTDQILNRLVDPSTPGNWYRSGLVVGHVQSGKTGNFIGLANKAMDVGFKIILILTGMYSDLRMQTQKRFDKGAIGRVTDPNSEFYGQAIGVGAYKGHPNVINLTSSSMRGDFGSLLVNVGGVLTSPSPTIMVCKKNSSILSNIIKKFAQDATIAEDGYPIVPNIPLMVIDDEADSASINTKYDKKEITEINAKIRTILSLFSKRVYVGYTATPYANIFIDPDQIKVDKPFKEIDEINYRLCKDDLFPKNFIINLSAPSNYIGPSVLFGIPSVYDEQEPGPDESKALRIIERINDGFKSRKKGAAPSRKEDLPDSLVQAIKCFFVSTAVRRARGQRQQHSSMLVNVSQFIDWMDAIASFVQQYVQDYCDMLAAIDDNPTFEEELKSIYFSKLVPANESVCSIHPDWAPQLKQVSWSQIRKELPIVAAKLRSEVRVSHSGLSEDENLNMTKLNYEDYENRKSEIDNGLYTIVVGGNTMSRGITLEGLTVSYFFRTTHTFDALMQMGRWFGYRDGYVDVCRLFMEKDMEVNFRNIAVATQEMRDDFDDMTERNIRPKDFGLKVKSFPGVLEVTSRNKFGSAVKGELSLNRTTLQAYQIYRDKETIKSNKDTTLLFLGRLGAPSFRKRLGHKMPHLFWECKAEEVIEFIKGFKNATVRMPSNLVSSYIEAQNRKGDLTEWTVALVNVTRGKPSVKKLSFGGTIFNIGTSKRKDETDGSNSVIYSVANSALIGPIHESLDLDDDAYKRALESSKADWKKMKENNQITSSEPTCPYPPRAKQERDAKRGLLLLFAVDFQDGVDDIFSFALSMPEISKENETVISYEYVGQPIAFTKAYDPAEMFKEVDDEN